MSTEKIITNNPKNTQRIAAKLAKQILQQEPGGKAIVLALRGNLGAGKTTFLQGFARGLGIKEKVLSPTFVLMRKFQIPNYKSRASSKCPNSKLALRFKIQDARYKFFYHIDCYRLKSKKDLETLGFKKINSNPENIIAIEWPEKISKILQSKFLEIKFIYLKDNKRKLAIK